MKFNLICGFGPESQSGCNMVLKSKTLLPKEIRIDFRMFELDEDLEII